MWNYFSKFLAAFSYGAGFILAIVCAVYAVNQYSNSNVQVASSHAPNSEALDNYSEDIEIKNIRKLSNYTNYSNEGEKEEFIFTGELTNNSSKKSYEKLMVEIDLYDVENKFIYKCGGWNGVGLIVKPQKTATFQISCHNMPAEIAIKYNRHKAVVKRQRF